MTAPAIELVGVERTFPGNPPVQALVDVDLTIEPGEMVSVSGPSGSGKSTLLHLMGTLDRPTSGTVRIDGMPTAELEERDLCRLRARHVGFVFQGFHLIESASLLDNVANGLLYRGVRRRTRLAHARRALAIVGLAERTTALPPALSGGQRQRVAIARALVGSPSLILADEPTGNLDSRTGNEIMSLLVGLHRDEGATIAIITHDEQVAQRAPRRLQVLDGRVASFGPSVSGPRPGSTGDNERSDGDGMSDGSDTAQ